MMSNKASATLDEHIEAFGMDGFSPEANAQHIFTTYGEAEITKRINKMVGIQQSIESVLKQKVRSNYGMFLLASEQINQVGVEMAESKQLVENTQKLLNEVSNSRVIESRAMRTNSLLPSLQLHKALGSTDFDRADSPTFRSGSPAAMMTTATGVSGISSSSSSSSSSSATKIPSWITEANAELSKYIIERQYEAAVAIVLRARENIASIAQQRAHSEIHESVAVKEQTDRIMSILDGVQQRGVSLACTIKRSLLNIPNSPLWGATEQQKRLRLLISLGEFSMAAESFAHCQSPGIKRVLKSVETSDALQFATELSLVFFKVLGRSSKSFMQLFGEHCIKPAIISLLLVWFQGRVMEFAEVLTKHMRFGIGETAALVIINLRDLVSGRGARDFSGSGGVAAFAAGAPTIIPSNNTAAALAAAAVTTTDESLYDSFSGGDTSFSSPAACGGALSVGATVGKMNPLKSASESIRAGLVSMRQVVGPGALYNTAHCLTVAFTEARKMDALKLPGSACLGWLVLPEIRGFISEYIQEFIRETRSQVKQDTWSPANNKYLPFCSIVHAPSRHRDVNSSCANDPLSSSSSTALLLLSQSYVWVVAALNHLCAEVWSLLHAEEYEQLYGDNSEGGASSSSVDRVSGGGLNDHRSEEKQSGLPSVSTSTSASYKRSDLCEVEPTAVACILRVLLRFVVEVESIDSKGFSKAQMACFAQTLSSTVERLIPSLQHVISSCFFAEGGALTQNPPSLIFKTVSARLTRLIKEKCPDVSSP